MSRILGKVLKESESLLKEKEKVDIARIAIFEVDEDLENLADMKNVQILDYEDPAEIIGVGEAMMDEFEDILGGEKTWAEGEVDFGKIDITPLQASEANQIDVLLEEVLGEGGAKEMNSIFNLDSSGESEMRYLFEGDEEDMEEGASKNGDDEDMEEIGRIFEGGDEGGNDDEDMKEIGRIFEGGDEGGDDEDMEEIGRIFEGGDEGGDDEDMEEGASKNGDDEDGMEKYNYKEMKFDDSDPLGDSDDDNDDYGDVDDVMESIKNMIGLSEDDDNDDEDMEEMGKDDDMEEMGDDDEDMKEIFSEGDDDNDDDNDEKMKEIFG